MWLTWMQYFKVDVSVRIFIAGLFFEFSVLDLLCLLCYCPWRPEKKRCCLEMFFHPCTPVVTESIIALFVSVRHNTMKKAQADTHWCVFNVLALWVKGLSCFPSHPRPGSVIPLVLFLVLFLVWFCFLFCFVFLAISPPFFN